MNRLAKCLILGGSLLHGIPALAQNGDDANRASARALGNEGIDAYDRGDDATAIDKLERAYRVVPIPTLGLWLARALARSGRLVEASERYGEVIRLEVTTGSVAAQREAQERAEVELAQLLPRIPCLDIAVEGAAPEAVEVAVDGAVVPTALLGVPRRVNPGTRTVTAGLGDQVVTEHVTLTEGQRAAVVLRFTGGDSAAAVGSPAAPPVPTAVESAPDASRARRPAMAWVALGVGAAGFVVGGTTGGLAMAKRSSLADDCEGDYCREPAFPDVDRYNSLRTVSTVGFVIGGVGVVAGVGLLWVQPRSRGRGSTGKHGLVVAPQVGVDSVGLVGSF